MTTKLSRPELESKWAIWDLPTLEGLPSEDIQVWLTRVDDGCQILNIPVSQRMLTAIHFLRGPLKVAMKLKTTNWGYLESQQEIPSCVEKWDAFKTALKDLHKRRVHRDEADRIKLATGNDLLRVGSSVILPSLGVLAINAAGFTPAGVAAGSIAAKIQSVVYGASTGGLFSVFQSTGATTLVAPRRALGLGVAALGAGLACVLSGQGGSSNTEGGGVSDGNGGDDYDENDFNICSCTSCIEY